MTPRIRPTLFDCRTCNRFKWNDPSVPTQGGACHSKPPTVMVVGVSKLGQPVIQGIWPPVGAGDYCFDRPFAKAMTEGPVALRQAGPSQPLASANGHGASELDMVDDGDEVLPGEEVPASAPPVES